MLSPQNNYYTNLDSLITKYSSRSEYYSKKGKKWLLLSFALCILFVSLCVIIGVIFINYSNDSERYKPYVFLGVICLIIVFLMFFYLNLMMKMVISSYHLTRTYREKSDALFNLNQFCNITELDEQTKIQFLKDFISNIEPGILQDSSKLYVDLPKLLKSLPL